MSDLIKDFPKYIKTNDGVFEVEKAKWVSGDYFTGELEVFYFVKNANQLGYYERDVIEKGNKLEELLWK